MGEWGGITEGNDKLLDLNLKYLRSMRDYILENKYKLHHTFWCINIDSADTGGLFTRDEGTPFEGGRDLKWNDNKYDNYLLPVLWKNEDGKFQGLDHEIPLGKNGVPLPKGNSPATPTRTPVTPTPTVPPTPTPSNSTVVKGDFNGDKEVNSLDFAILRQYLVGKIKQLPVEDPIASGDLNGDNDVNSLDFAMLRMYLLGKIQEF
jgi:endoglucanase